MSGGEDFRTSFSRSASHLRDASAGKGSARERHHDTVGSHHFADDRSGKLSGRLLIFLRFSLFAARNAESRAANAKDSKANATSFTGNVRGLQANVLSLTPDVRGLQLNVTSCTLDAEGLQENVTSLTGLVRILAAERREEGSQT